VKFAAIADWVDSDDFPIDFMWRLSNFLCKQGDFVSFL
jgi:hypothetical protein